LNKPPSGKPGAVQFEHRAIIDKEPAHRVGEHEPDGRIAIVGMRARAEIELVHKVADHRLRCLVGGDGDLALGALTRPARHCGMAGFRGHRARNQDDHRRLL